MYVDSHCHLNFPELQGRLGAVRQAMQAAGVDAALCICTTVEEFDAVQAIAAAHDEIWCSAGVHPDTEGGIEPSLQQLCAFAARPRVIAIGETGLDYYRLNGRSVADMGWQRERFATHIQASLQTGKPLVIHTRSASEDTLAILRSEGGTRARGVFHCFTETMEVARAALDLGFLISFSGILTFRNAEALREVARYVPLERCLIETDSPYLAPVPHRGKTNEPAYVPLVAAQLATLKGIAVEAVAESTRANFEALFGVQVPRRPAAATAG